MPDGFVAPATLGAEVTAEHLLGMMRSSFDQKRVSAALNAAHDAGLTVFDCFFVAALLAGSAMAQWLDGDCMPAWMAFAALCSDAEQSIRIAAAAPAGSA
jgi:hypothetical protein